MADMVWKVGDTGPVWRLDLGDQQSPGSWTLDGADVTLYLWDAVTGNTAGSAACSVLAEDDAVVQFDPLDVPSLTLTARDLFAEVVVTFPSGRVETFPNDAHLLVRVHDDSGGG